jgi:hypothetical protein
MTRRVNKIFSRISANFGGFTIDRLRARGLEALTKSPTDRRPARMLRAPAEDRQFHGCGKIAQAQWLNDGGMIS